MAPHSSTLAWKIPWMEEPGRLQSMESLRVRHNRANSLSLFTFMHWRRKWQLTPVFLPGESQGWGSLVGCRLWGRTESDTTEVTLQQSSNSQVACVFSSEVSFLLLNHGVLLCHALKSSLESVFCVLIISPLKSAIAVFTTCPVTFSSQRALRHVNSFSPQTFT